MDLMGYSLWNQREKILKRSVTLKLEEQQFHTIWDPMEVGKLAC